MQKSNGERRSWQQVWRKIAIYEAVVHLSLYPNLVIPPFLPAVIGSHDKDESLLRGLMLQEIFEIQITLLGHENVYFEKRGNNFPVLHLVDFNLQNPNEHERLKSFWPWHIVTSVC